MTGAENQVNVDEIRGFCAEIKRQGIRTVAVSSFYAPIDHEFPQEEQARAILRAKLPDVKVTISKEVANIGGFYLCRARADSRHPSTRERHHPQRRAS
jgi:N-methylhydantoinase A/oxoprolinase/acetone carboxylase beta subunit